VSRLRAQRYTKNARNDAFLAIIRLSVKLITFLTFRKWLIYSVLQKSYKNALKKVTKKCTTYQKNAYLCIVLINKRWFYRFQKLRKMKILVFMYAGNVAVSYASCGSKAQTAEVDTDSDQDVDSAANSVGVADTVTADSVK
jgi:hypothetical protein